MGTSRESTSGPALAANQGRETPAAVLDFAVAQILRGDNGLGALPAVLERMVTGFGLRAAWAFQPSAGQQAAVLAAYPDQAADPALLARIGALSAARRNTDSAIAPVQLTLEGPARGSTLVTYSVPLAARCAVALIGDGPVWDEEIRATARAVAAIVAAQMRHEGDLAQQGNGQLDDHEARLRKTDDLRNQFLAIVSHELRTPLTSILSFIDLMRVV